MAMRSSATRRGVAAALVLGLLAGLQPPASAATRVTGRTATGTCDDGVARLIAGIAIDFPRGSARPVDAARPLLDAVAKALKACPTAGLSLSDDGRDDCQLAPDRRLSDARAVAVVDELVARGVERERLKGQGATDTPGGAPKLALCAPDGAGPVVDPKPPVLPSPDTVRPTPPDTRPAGGGWSWWWLLLPLLAVAAALVLLLWRGRRSAAAAAPEPVMRNAIGIPAALGPPDNLMLIKGVGPKLNALLISLGIRRFDQIAAWTPEDVALVDAHLHQFHGRIGRDSWIEQAALLDRGAMEEFTAKFGRLDDGD